MFTAIESVARKRTAQLPPHQEIFVQELEAIFYPGSFLFSVQSLFGHMLVGMLAARYYEDTSTDVPQLPNNVYQTLPLRDVLLPGGHARVVDKNMQVAGVWYNFLRCAVPPEHMIKHEPVVEEYYASRVSASTRELTRQLVEVVAESDRLYIFPNNLGRTGSSISHQFGPSLVKSMILQDRFPRADNRVYSWLLPEMRALILEESEDGFKRLPELAQLFGEFESAHIQFFEE